jgi:regulatory protein
VIVTNLSQQKRDNNRVNVYVDGVYSFALSVAAIVDLKIKVGLEIDELFIKNAKKLSDDEKRKFKALEWLLMRPRSKREFADYLRRKECDEALSGSLKHYFTEKGLLNDLAFANWWIEQRLAKNRSERFIRAELAKKGVQKQIVDEAFLGRDSSEVKKLNSVIQKKRHKYSDERKLIEYLLRQGFVYSDIKEALAEEAL